MKASVDLKTGILQLQRLMLEAMNTVNVLSVFVNGVEEEVYLCSDVPVQIPGLAGITIQKMPNLKSDQYTVAEVLCKKGAFQDDVSVPNAVSIHIMRGELAFKTDTLPWTIFAAGDVVRFAKGELHSFYIIEDTSNIVIYTPPLK